MSVTLAENWPALFFSAIDPTQSCFYWNVMQQNWCQMEVKRSNGRIRPQSNPYKIKKKLLVHSTVRLPMVSIDTIRPQSNGGELAFKKIVGTSPFDLSTAYGGN